MDGLTDFARERIEIARRIVSKRGSLRAGLPDAWYFALMHLRRDIHLPEAARDAFAFLSNEMCRALEGDPNGDGLKFMDGITDEDVQRAGAAFWNIYAAVSHQATPQAFSPEERAALCARLTGRVTDPVAFLSLLDRAPDVVALFRVSQQIAIAAVLDPLSDWIIDSLVNSLRCEYLKQWTPKGATN